MGDRAKPLTGRTVVVTRPRASAGPLAALLRARGARPVAAPLIRTLPPRSWRPLDASLRALSRYDAAAFASARAVDAFFSRAKKVLHKRPDPPGVVAAVGPATARALAAAGWRATAVAEERRAEGLARALRLPKGSRVLIPRAERGREALPRLLRARGLSASAVPAYRTVPDAAGQGALRRALAGGADAVCFASGSAVEAAASACRGGLARALRGCAAVAIGPTTAAALRRRGVAPAAVAGDAGDAALAAAVTRALRGRP